MTAYEHLNDDSKEPDITMENKRLVVMHAFGRLYDKIVGLGSHTYAYSASLPSSG